MRKSAIETYSAKLIAKTVPHWEYSSVNDVL